MYETVAGLLLQTLEQGQVARTLGLYPPDYDLAGKRTTHSFTLLIVEDDSREGAGLEEIQSRFVSKARDELEARGIARKPSAK